MEYEQLFYEDGSLKAEGWLDGDQKENFWYHYYPNQKVEAKGRYSHNKKEGYWYFYNANGTPKCEGYYRKNMAFSWWRYYSEERVMSVELQNGRKEGLALYKVNGTPVKAVYYKYGRPTQDWMCPENFRKDPN